MTLRSVGLIARALLALLAMGGCGGDPESGPGKVVWDRDVCERCQMVLSDPSFGAQVRTGEGRLHRFDDPGCALLWMHEHPGREVLEIWVRALDGSDGIDGSGWIDARTARFVAVPHSPMGYGYGARPGPGDEGIGLDALWSRIEKVEDERRSADR